MQWTDRIRQVKIFLVLTAIIIAVASLVASNLLTRDLYVEEHKKMEIWAEAMRSLNEADDNTDLALVLKVIDGNTTIPIIVLDANDSVRTYRNIELPKAEGSSIEDVQAKGVALKRAGKSIRIELDREVADGYVDVCYDDSLMLKRLAVYPYIQLGVVLIFVVIAIFALMTSKRAEQNKVWVGLSKETAHQLGTPISSLMAWTQLLDSMGVDKSIVTDMDKDVKRLSTIADRFSKIGSMPDKELTSINEAVVNSLEYMRARIPKRVNLHIHTNDQTNNGVMLSQTLFAWVMENLTKNAVDAMDGEGRLDITVEDSPNNVVILVKDTGKGIPRKNFKNVFNPGFTTKKRGWGLGLTLVKRIIEEYHNGQIYIKESEVGKGTTFGIELPKVKS